MFRPLTITLAVTILLGAEWTGRAEPLTYDFSGTFLGGPGAVMTGPFSGSFTIDSDASMGSDGTLIERGSDVSIRIGNYEFENNPQNPTTLAWIGVSDQPNVARPVVADLEGYIGSIGLNFSMAFYNPGSVPEYLNLGNYEFSPSTLGSFNMNYQEGGMITSMNYGTIASIDLVSAPEPSTLLMGSIQKKSVELR